jgi:hypothetical protein
VGRSGVSRWLDRAIQELASMLNPLSCVLCDTARRGVYTLVMRAIMFRLDHKWDITYSSRSQQEVRLFTVYYQIASSSERVKISIVPDCSVSGQLFSDSVSCGFPLIERFWLKHVFDTIFG